MQMQMDSTREGWDFTRALLSDEFVARVNHPNMQCEDLAKEEL